MVKGLTRSALYVPTDHDRAMAKTNALDCDIIIFDLEDGVAPERKQAGRNALVQAGLRESLAQYTIVVRINHRSTRDYIQDIAMLSELVIDGVMLSKVNDISDVDHVLNELAKIDRAELNIWCNIETPQGVINVREIAAHPSVKALVAGTNDLGNDLRIMRTPERLGMMHSLQEIQLAGRAHGCTVLDGTFVDLENADGLKAEAKQGRQLGFDGKTLIHPKQIATANAAFSPTQDEINHARAIIETYEKAIKDEKAVALLKGSMIEKLHYDRAKETLDIVKKTA